MKNTLPPNYDMWLEYVNRFVEAFVYGASIQVSCEEKRQAPIHPPAFNEQKILICSPHPDDEALTGTLPLRLHQEQPASVLNIGITLGSDPAGKAARLDELTAACDVLGFNLEMAGGPLAFDSVTSQTRGQDPAGWQEKVDILQNIFVRHKPDLVLFPHDDDSHSTHIGVHYLTIAALRQYSMEADKEVLVVETEFWHPMRDPNLLIGVTAEDVALMVAALTHHQGELARNPYHLRLPPRLMDNVRRGAELIGGCRRKAPDFVFGELYRVSRMVNGSMQKSEQRRFIGPQTGISLSLLKELF